MEVCWHPRRARVRKRMVLLVAGCGAPTIAGEFAMTYFETQQGPMHAAQFNPQQWAQFNPQNAQAYGAWLGTPSPQGIGYGLGQAAFGQQYGQFGGQPPIGAFGYNAGWGAQPQWSHQQQPQWWGQQQRQLSQHDVNEVVRQLL